jgi:hypothetical protein
MNRLIPMTGALVLALGVSQAALAQNGNGNGNGNGQGKGRDSGQQGPGARGPQEQRGPQERGLQARGPQGREQARGPEARGPQQRGPEQRGPSSDRGPQRDVRRAEVRVQELEREVRRGPMPGTGPGNKDGRDYERDVRRDLERRIDRNTVPVVFRRDGYRELIAGCPPGLARKGNGCLPPGQARQIAQTRYNYDRYDYLWRTRGDDYRYRYDDGYVYRMNNQGGLLGYLPVLGGVLSTGNAWPGQYNYQQAPQYYADYYGLNDQYQYRYADGVLYGVNPQTNSIGQVAALLTGQQFNVGQRMPAGYDIYNVPYGYRDQYADNADSWYRYNDGYVYQIDPTTQLVQAVIQLLT